MKIFEKEELLKMSQEDTIKEFSKSNLDKAIDRKRLYKTIAGIMYQIAGLEARLDQTNLTPAQLPKKEGNKIE
jgi:hypothetical protein